MAEHLRHELHAIFVLKNCLGELQKHWQDLVRDLTFFKDALGDEFGHCLESLDTNHIVRIGHKFHQLIKINFLKNFLKNKLRFFFGAKFHVAYCLSHL